MNVLKQLYLTSDYHDKSGVWSESMVAMMQDIYGIETYRIRDDYIKT